MIDHVVLILGCLNLVVAVHQTRKETVVNSMLLSKKVKMADLLEEREDCVVLVRLLKQICESITPRTAAEFYDQFYSMIEKSLDFSADFSQVSFQMQDYFLCGNDSSEGVMQLVTAEDDLREVAKIASLLRFDRSNRRTSFCLIEPCKPLLKYGAAIPGVAELVREVGSKLSQARLHRLRSSVFGSWSVRLLERGLIVDAAKSTATVRALFWTNKLKLELEHTAPKATLSRELENLRIPALKIPGVLNALFSGDLKKANEVILQAMYLDQGINLLKMMEAAVGQSTNYRR